MGLLYSHQYKTLGGKHGGGYSEPQLCRKIFTNTPSPQEKLTKHRHHNLYFYPHDFKLSPHLQTLDIILLHLNSFPQNKHIITLVTPTVIICLYEVHELTTDTRTKLMLPSDKTTFPRKSCVPTVTSTTVTEINFAVQFP